MALKINSRCPDSKVNISGASQKFILKHAPEYQLFSDRGKQGDDDNPISKSPIEPKLVMTSSVLQLFLWSLAHFSNPFKKSGNFRFMFHSMSGEIAIKKSRPRAITRKRIR